MPAAPPETTTTPNAARALGLRGTTARTWAPIAAVVALAAALRCSTLGLQSYWFDEGVTVGLLHKGFGGMLSALPHSESTPPLYYVVAWIWARVFGFGEVGLRLLSALAGVATVAVLIACGRRIAGPRVGLVAGLLAAVNPFLVWYSQEARSYSLLALLCAGSLLAFLSAIEDGAERRPLLAWAVLSALALATHYFAAFLIGPELVWLALEHRRRPAAPAAIALVVLAAVALMPLVIAQRNTKNADFIGASSLSTRLLQVPKQLLVGYGFPGQGAVTVLAAVLTLVAVGAAVSSRRAWVPLALALAALIVPVVMAAGGLDYVLSRNLIEVWPPAVLVVALGIARLRVAGAVVLAGLVATGIAIVVLIDTSPRYQRDDWRGAIHAATRGGASPRAIVVNSTVADVMFSVYAPRFATLPPTGIAAREVDVLDIAARAPRRGLEVRPIAVAPPPPGFAPAAGKRTSTYALVRYEAPMPTPVSPAQIVGGQAPGSVTFIATP